MRRRVRPGSAPWHEALDAHCAMFLGPSPVALGEIMPSSPIQITLVPHSAGADRPFQTLRTAGVSDHPMHVPEGREDQRHCELLTYLPADWDLEAGDGQWWPGALLKLLGQFVHEQQTWYQTGHTILVSEADETYAPGTLVAAVVLRPPHEHPDFDALTIEETRCRFLWAFPITHAEVEHKLEHGPDALLDLIEEHLPSHVLDPARPCLITGQAPSHGSDN